MVQNICIIHPKIKINKIISKILNNYNKFICYNETYEDIKQFKQKIKLSEINISNLMDNNYKPSLELYSSILMKYMDNNPEYANMVNTGPIMEKNGWPNQNIIDLAFYKTIKEFKQKDDFIVLTSSIFLKNLIINNKNINTLVIGKLHFKIDKIKNFIKDILLLIYNIIYTFFSVLYLKVKLKDLNLNNIKSDKIVIIRDFAKSNYFINNKFTPLKTTDLYQFYEKENYNVIHNINWIVEKKVSKLVKDINKYEDNNFIFIHEKYINLLDFYYAIINIFKYLKLIKKFNLTYDFYIKNINLTDVFQNYIKSLLPFKLKNKGIYSKIVILNWENKAYEKALIQNFRIVNPKIQIYGYMAGIHSFVEPIGSLTKKELNIMPLPNKLICIGEFSKNMLKSFGYKESLLKIGPLLRYSYILTQNINDKVDDKKDNMNILVSFPLLKSLTQELLEIIIEAVPQNLNYMFILRFHPYDKSNYTEKISRLMNYKNVSISNNIFYDDLKIARYFIFTGTTTTGYEALVKGLKVLEYKSKYRYCLNNISDLGHVHEIFSNVYQLKKVLDKVNLLNYDINQIKEILFNLKNDYEVFLP